MFSRADDEAGADERADHGADAAEQRHQDHLARHCQVDVGQRGELEDDRLGSPASPASAADMTKAASL